MKWWRTLIQHPFKIVEDRETGSTELYDLEKDPAERTNLAPAWPERAVGLREALAEALREGHGGPVRALAEKRPSPEMEERLRALGYVD
jgi:hypothetical protein